MLERALHRDEIERIWTIDRSEIHDAIYQWRDGALHRVPAYYEIASWHPDQIEQDTPVLYEIFDRGGVFIGMFDEDALVGVSVVDSKPFGEGDGCRQLKYLYVSHAYRQQGIASRLFRAAVAWAEAQGGSHLYISATPTENTVHFYQRRGAVVTPTPDPMLYALEPDDIHMLYAL